MQHDEENFRYMQVAHFCQISVSKAVGSIATRRPHHDRGHRHHTEFENNLLLEQHSVDGACISNGY